MGVGLGVGVGVGGCSARVVTRREQAKRAVRERGRRVALRRRGRTDVQGVRGWARRRVGASARGAGGRGRVQALPQRITRLFMSEGERPHPLGHGSFPIFPFEFSNLDQPPSCAPPLLGDCRTRGRLEADIAETSYSWCLSLQVKMCKRTAVARSWRGAVGIGISNGTARFGARGTPRRPRHPPAFGSGTWQLRPLREVCRSGN